MLQDVICQQQCKAGCRVTDSGDSIVYESELDSSWSVPTSEASSVDSEACSVSASESTEEDEEPSSQSECMMMSRASCVL
ncbi:hypothetical protein NQZ68_004750 [Dissostichus eleginoides]|nr:hypothetical protein NQZ68_004750 [Dissostichus eleginoides]